MNDTTSRHRSPYSFKENLLRIAWAACAAILFRWSPRPCWEIRNWLLRRFGAQVGSSVHIHNTARIFFPWKFSIGDHSAIGENVLIYNLGEIRCGAFVTISHGAQLCAGTHDYSSREMSLIRAVIRVEDDAWVCTEAFVGPNVTVGAGAIVGARAVVMRDVAPWTIVRGNPAQFIKQRPPFLRSAQMGSEGSNHETASHDA